MKKSTLLKLALMVVAMFIFAGAFAQPWTGAGNATVGKYDRSTLTNTYTGYDYTTDKLTVGTTMPFWTWPSAAYNPSFSTAAFSAAAFPTQGQIENAILSSFAWKSVDPGANDAATLAALTAATAIPGYTKNYVEVPIRATIGKQLLEVIETANPSLCTGLPVYFGFTAIAVPTLTITNAAAANQYGLSTASSSVISSGCGTQTLAITGTVAPFASPTTASTEENPFHINMPYAVYNVNALDGSGNIILAGATNITGNAGVPMVYGANGTAVPSASNPIVLTSTAGAGENIVASQGYSVQNTKITVYEFTYNNINGAISRKSDYLGVRGGTLTGLPYGFTYYPTVATNFKYYVVALPVPVTGPIYHISNSFVY